jgi:hypothetical protein
MTPLRQRMLEDMQLRNLSLNTPEAYVRAVAQLAKFDKQSPEQLQREEVRAYLVHAVQQRRVSASTFNQIRCALCFLYHFLAVLHTGGQNLHLHPHLQCVVPGGGIALDGTRWVPCRPGFFLPVRVLSRLLRGQFLAFLHEANQRGQRAFQGRQQARADPARFSHLLGQLRQKEGVV